MLICFFYSSFHDDCVDCGPVCDVSDHNYDKQTCTDDCSLFNRQVEIKSILDEIKNLKIFLTITFVLVLLVLILFCAINGKTVFRWFSNLAASMKKKEKQTEPVTMANPNTTSPKARRREHPTMQQNYNNRTSSIFTVSGTEYDQKTVSTPISRHPAEDTLTSSVTTVDYSYDNKALQLTPVGDGTKPKTETNF